jgi:hypothetical protein
LQTGGCKLITDRKYDFAGRQKIKEIIFWQAPVTQPFPHFQSAFQRDIPSLSQSSPGCVEIARIRFFRPGRSPVPLIIRAGEKGLCEIYEIRRCKNQNRRCVYK